MDVESIRLFAAVVELGSFAAVARERGLDPSSVSRAISSLETELGFRLFQRTTRKLSPTEAGNAYFLNIRDLIEQLEHAADAARDLVQQPIGTLRITTSTFFGQTVLAPLLPELVSLFPTLSFDLVLADHHVDIVAERIDLAIRFGVRPEGDLVAVELRERKFVVAASPSYVAANGAPETPADLADHSCIRLSMPGYREHWRFRLPGGDPTTVAVGGRIQVSHGGTAVACAINGAGPAMLADWAAAPHIASGTLVEFFPEHEVTGTEFDTACWLVYPSGSYVPQKVEVVARYLRDKLGSE